MSAQNIPALRRYFFDTEFNDTAPGFQIDFISIGIVNENGADFYGISNAFNLAAAAENPWIRKNVLNKLDHHKTWKTIDEIRAGILDLIEPAEEIEFWAKNGSYDNVLLCQIFGGMGPLREALQKEKGIKDVTFRDTKELLRIAVNPQIHRMPEAKKHISINDAHNERYVVGQCEKAIAAQTKPTL
jgi:hypothetical protein